MAGGRARRAGGHPGARNRRSRAASGWLSAPDGVNITGIRPWGRRHGNDGGDHLGTERSGEEFEPDELARKLLKSKSEVPLCDALAARLGAQFADRGTTWVAREWGRGVRALGRLRIDLAVLYGDRAVALIEAKVARSFDLANETDRRCPSGPVRDDIEKLRMVDVDGERLRSTNGCGTRSAA